MTDPQTVASTIVDRYKSDRDIVKKLLGMLPLYSSALGNHEYESADGLLRKEIADRFVTYKLILQKAEENLIKKSLIAQIGKTEPATAYTDKLALSIRSASYGLTGMGSGFKPGETELQQLTNLDAVLLQAAIDLESKYQEVQNASSEKPEDVEGKVDLLVKELQLYDKSFQTRKAIFTGIK